MDFFNFELLEYLINQCFLFGLNEQLERFKRYREGFLMTTELCHYFGAHKTQVPHGFHTLVVMCDLDVHQHLKWIDDIRTILAWEVGCSKHHMIFAGLTQGSGHAVYSRRTDASNW